MNKADGVIDWCLPELLVENFDFNGSIETSEQQRERDKPNSCQNYKPRTKAVNQRSRQYTNRKPGEKESEKETLRYLSSCEGEGLNEVGVKNRETIKIIPTAKKRFKKVARTIHQP